ncbi:MULTISPECIES: DUF6233 domain-containing protein [Streptomyces]|uniref:DUF6233 domain-containing protein n=1 Tax=Streptomyces glycanivorans TaxID=3033808 RepID=A0ABY9JN54_9ACTN|nr:MULTISPECIES: DUF6233 domain-containing protein [unclassified Streptomyces]WSQ81886.1 DUF6233 domain-containing protein [Streptomyces sp. NBC_01213]TXS12024.1 hypothetical protein EAO68_24085 [Streptomyces sp. wa22]WLQ68530.1 DUF6233 domain-containing protein [Streptomyces sp. Alt3]WSQ89213.1 DUF6233 domain-containing protein [Streptomyces sp. NBC_01212]WSR04781.1 DUF6233 domain-containing protein [Streptomyces sp. NBC_01208]
MTGGISRLEKWRATREYLAWQLRHADHRIRELEALEQRERHLRERARAERSWKIQPQRSSSSALLHRGNCTLYRNDSGFISRDEAIIALAEPDIEPCQICNPQTGLR